MTNLQPPSRGGGAAAMCCAAVLTATMLVMVACRSGNAMPGRESAVPASASELLAATVEPAPPRLATADRLEVVDRWIRIRCSYRLVAKLVRVEERWVGVAVLTMGVGTMHARFVAVPGDVIAELDRHVRAARTGLGGDLQARVQWTDDDPEGELRFAGMDWESRLFFVDQRRQLNWEHGGEVELLYDRGGPGREATDGWLAYTAVLEALDRTTWVDSICRPPQPR